MANLDLTPPEVVALVKLVSAVPENVMVVNENNELTFLENMTGVETLAVKINRLGEDPEVVAYIAENYGEEN